MTLGHSGRPEKACKGGFDPTTATARLWNRRSQELLSSSPEEAGTTAVIWSHFLLLACKFLAAK